MRSAKPMLGGDSDVGNIELEPLFVDANNGDFHVKCQGGRGMGVRKGQALDLGIAKSIDGR